MLETEKAPMFVSHRPSSMQLRICLPGAHLLLHSMGCRAEALLELPLGLVSVKHRQQRMCNC